MLWENATDERLASWCERRVAGTPVAGTRSPLYQPLLLEPVDEIGNSAARNEDLALQFSEEERATMVQCLHDGKLGEREAMPCHIILRVPRHRVARTRQNDE